MKRSISAVVVAAVCLLSLPGAVRADLGNCFPQDPWAPYQGGIEYDLDGTSRGISAVITARLLDLCNNTIDPADSRAWVSVWLASMPFPQQPHGIAQIGYRKKIGDACSKRIYAWRSVNTQQALDSYEHIGPCATTGVKYRFRIERLTDDLGVYWRTYVLVESTQALFWDAPAPASLGWTIDRAKYMFATENKADQSGGGNLSRGKLESAYWKNSSNTWVAAAMFDFFHNPPDHQCDYCGTEGPYNIDWLSGRAFEVWTDGF